MKAFYNIVKVLSDHLKANYSINEVTLGNLSEVDLKKQTIYPLAHIMIDRVNYGPATQVFEIRILVADIVYESQNDSAEEVDPIKGTNNLQDVFNTTLSVINTLQTHLRIGNIEDSYYKLASEPTVEPFQDRFNDLVAGWVMNVSIEIPNADVSICDYTILPALPPSSANPLPTNVEQTSYSRLKGLKDDGNLVTGRMYLITDFQTTHNVYKKSTITTIINSGSIEPLMVTAISAHEVDLVAKSYTNPNDIIWYDIDSNFCEDGTTPRTGKIYYRKDTIKNIGIWEDFRAVKHYRVAGSAPEFDDTATYTFKDLVNYNGIIYKCKITGTTGLYPDMEPFNWGVWCDTTSTFNHFFLTDTPTTDKLGDCYVNQLTYDSDNYGLFYTFSLANGTQGCEYVQDINIGKSSYAYCNNVFIVPTNSMYFAKTRAIEIGNDSYGNTFNGKVNNITTSNGFSLNLFYLGNANDNTIGEYCIGNTIGSGFMYNNVAGNLLGNTMGESCFYNNFAVEFVYNTIGTLFGNNKTGIDTLLCRYADNVWGNEFGYYSESSHYGSYTQDCITEQRIGSCIFPENMTNARIPNGIRGLNLRAVDPYLIRNIQLVSDRTVGNAFAPIIFGTTGNTIITLLPEPEYTEFEVTATTIGRTSATLTTYVNPKNAYTAVYFRYGTTTGVENSISPPVLIEDYYDEQIRVEGTIQGLQANTTYFIGVKFVNSLWDTAIQGLGEFTTLP